MSTGKLPLMMITGSSANFYEHCYQNCQPDSNGNISSSNAASLLKTSGLPDKILSEIWENSDSSGKGFLTNYEFHVALKLVALAQHRVEPKLHNLQIAVSSPILNVSNSNHHPDGTMSPTNVWSISIEEQKKYSMVFDGLNSEGGKLSGEAVKPVFINSKLPVGTLGQVWTLSDIDKDGSLDRDEFILAMYLIYKCLAGEEPPKSLQSHLIPPSKRRPPSASSIQSSFKSFVSSGSLQSSFQSSSLRVPSTDWVVGKLEKERYDTQFFAADKDKDGLLSGSEIRDSFVQSGLPQNTLAKIWDLCDVSKSGMLNSEQFALAMHLINEQISSAGTKLIPSILSATMMPPSLRNKVCESGPSETLTLTSFGLKTESDDVYDEIEIIRRDRAQVEQVCRQYEADYKSQIQEVAELQETLDRTSQTTLTLSKQKEEAQHRLDDLTEQKNQTQVVLEETRSKCKEERDQLEALKSQIGSQAACIEGKREDLKRLQGELNDLIREEASLREQVQQHQSRLVAIEQETCSTEALIAAAEDRNTRLETLRSRLQEVIGKYDAVVARPDCVDVVELPNSAEVDALLASSFAEQGNSSHVWPSDDDPFMKDDPFSSVMDPFSSVVDPFSSTGDPFASQDPFSAGGAWSSNNASSDQHAAFSIGLTEDLFKHMNMSDGPPLNHFESHDDPFGFGDSPFDQSPQRSTVPPRPTKVPLGDQTRTVPVNSDVGVYEPILSEKDELSLAKQESERVARAAEAARKQEKADFEMAVKLSQTEYKTQERKKTHKNKK